MSKVIGWNFRKSSTSSSLLLFRFAGHDFLYRSSLEVHGMSYHKQISLLVNFIPAHIPARLFTFLFSMRPLPFSAIGILAALSILGAHTVLAQSRCDTVRIEDGEGEYQQCLRDEREERANEQIDLYRTKIDYQRRVRELSYDQKRTKADILWKESDFSYERQIQEAEQQIALIKLSTAADNPEIRRLEVRIDDLNQKRDLLSAQKDRMISLYDVRQDMENRYLDLQMQRYELTARSITPLNFEW